MKSSSLIRFVVLALGFSSCTTSNEYFKMGDFYNATLKSIKKLNSRKSKKQERVLSESYPKTIRLMYDNILFATEYPISDKWSSLDHELKNINDLSDAINSSRVVLRIDKHLLADLQKKVSQSYFGRDENESKEYKLFLHTSSLAKMKYFEWRYRQP